MSYFLKQIEVPIRLAVSQDGVQHRRFTSKAWKQEVTRGTTILGYHDWVSSKIVGEFELPEPTDSI